MKTTADSDLLFLIASILEGRKVIAYSTCVFVVVGIAYALLATPQYTATIQVMPVTQQDGLGMLDGVSKSLGSVLPIAGLTSGPAVSKKDEAFAAIRSKEFFGKFLLSDRLLSLLTEGQVTSVNDSFSKNRVYKAFLEKSLHVSEDRRTGIITLGVTLAEPKYAGETVLKVVESVNQLMKQKSLQESEKSLAYLNELLGQTKVVELQNAIYRLMETQVKSMMLANTRDEFVFKIVGDAYIPESDEKTSPKRKLIVIMSLLLGLILSTFFYVSYKYICSINKLTK